MVSMEGPDKAPSEEQANCKRQKLEKCKDNEVSGAVKSEEKNECEKEENEVSSCPNEASKESQDATPESTKESANQKEAEGRKTSKKVKRKHIDPLVLETRTTIQMCCKKDDLHSALEAYKEAISKNIKVEPQSLHNLVCLCDGLGDRGIHIGTTRERQKAQEDGAEGSKLKMEVSLADRKANAFLIKKHMDEKKVPLNDASYTAFVKLLCKTQDMEAAERFCAEMEAHPSIKPRLRLYSSLMHAYAHQNDLKGLLNVWHRMHKFNIEMTEPEYCYALKCATAAGDVSVVDKILSDLAEFVLVPSHATTAAIQAWFTSPFAKHHTQPTATLLDTVALDDLSPSIGPITSPKGYQISPSCQIDTQTAAFTSGCLISSKLQPIELSPTSWQRILDMNETIVLQGALQNDPSPFQGGRKGKKRSFHSDTRSKQWNHFQQFLEEKLPFDVVIDGANVGYFKQNFMHAPKHVDYRQINWVVQHFQSQNKRILLVLHERHFSPKLMPSWAQSIVRSWEGILYKAPAGSNDDWYWLHAALRSGNRCLALTNDEMRDHHFQMLSQREFLRWKERHRIRFSFGVWITTSKNEKHREVQLIYPDIYSRRIQRVHDDKGIAIPLPKKGDENRFMDGEFVAEYEPVEETYICICPIE